MGDHLPPRCHVLSLLVTCLTKPLFYSLCPRSERTLYEFYQENWVDFGRILTDMEAAGMLVDREHLRQAQVWKGWGVVGGGGEGLLEHGSRGVLADREHLRQAQVRRYRGRQGTGTAEVGCGLGVNVEGKQGNAGGQGAPEAGAGGCDIGRASHRDG